MNVAQGWVCVCVSELYTEFQCLCLSIAVHSQYQQGKKQGMGDV